MSIAFVYPYPAHTSEQLKAVQVPSTSSWSEDAHTQSVPLPIIFEEAKPDNSNRTGLLQFLTNPPG